MRPPPPRYNDDAGVSLAVPEGLPRKEHFELKQIAYARAIAAWNTLEKTKRHRIQSWNMLGIVAWNTPTDTHLFRRPSSGEMKTPSEDEPSGVHVSQSMQDRWALDNAL